jgi:LmbE family N-acetylglucosaminyl deacetylase
MTMARSPKLLILGAHPDDAEFHAGALSIRYRELGYPVKWISATDGRSGHHLDSSEDLIVRRKAEAARSAARIGAECDVWPFPDGSLQPDLELRHAIIREIRQYQPDLVLTHRPWDYHPDHRALGQAVQDACYLVTVPRILPDTPALSKDPVVASMVDLFQRPVPFCPDFVLDGTPEFDRVVDLLSCHVSQVFEFLPVSFNAPEPVPSDPKERNSWLARWFATSIAGRVEAFAPLLDAPPAALLEAYEVSEYASQLSRETLAGLFPGCVDTSL